MAEDHVSEEELEAGVEAEQDSPVEGEAEPEGEVVVPEGEEVVETPEEPVEVQEEPDNDEKSRLGRRTKRVEDRTERMEKMLETLLESQQPQDKEEDIDRDMPLTYGDLGDFLDKREHRKTKSTQKYFDDYTMALADLSRDLPDDVAMEILKEHDNSFASKSHSDPAVAARINFAEAKAEVMSKRVGKVPVRHNPLKGPKVDVPSGTSGGSRMKKKEDEGLGLDEETKSIIKELGLTEEQAKEALSEGSSTLKTKE